MTMDHAALLEVLEAMKSAGVSERITLAATTIYQALINAELTAVIGAGPWEHSPDRTAHRNGYRPRVFSTAAGDLELAIPKLRSGSFFPSLMERRRRVDQALFAVVMEAYLHGVSTRKVDDLVKALGIDSGISKSEVSRDLCRSRCRGGRLRGPHPGRGQPDLCRLGHRSLRVPRPDAGRDDFPVRVLGCDLLQGPGQPPRGVPGGGDRHRCHRRRQA